MLFANLLFKMCYRICIQQLKLLCIASCAVVIIQNIAVAQETMQPCRISGYAYAIQCIVVEPTANNPFPATIYKVPARVRYPAKTPIVWIPDGIGQAANERAPVILSALSRLRNRYDIVWVDFHGVGPDIADCNLSASTNIQNRFYRLHDEQKVMRCLQATKQRYRYSNDIYTDYSNYYESVRKHLKVDQVILMSEGRGSHIANAWSALNAKAIKFQVVDSPQLLEVSKRASRFDEVLMRIIAICNVQSNCNKTFPDLPTKLQRLFNSLPVVTQIIDPISQKKVMLEITDSALQNSLLNILRTPAKAKYLPMAIDHTLKNDWAIWVGLNAVHWSKKESDFDWGRHMLEQCAYLPHRQAHSNMHSELSMWFYQTERKKLDRICTNPPLNITGVKEISTPTLLLVGKMNPTIDLTDSNYINKTVVTVENGGHGILTLGCTKDVVYRYFKAMESRIQPHVDNLQTRCLAQVPFPYIQTVSN